MAKPKFYTVWQGRKPGVYNSWADCEQQVKGFPNAKYKSFNSSEEATEASQQEFTVFIPNVTSVKRVDDSKASIALSDTVTLQDDPDLDYSIVPWE